MMYKWWILEKKNYYTLIKRMKFFTSSSSKSMQSQWWARLALFLFQYSRKETAVIKWKRFLYNHFKKNKLPATLPFLVKRENKTFLQKYRVLKKVCSFMLALFNQYTTAFRAQNDKLNWNFKNWRKYNFPSLKKGK